MVNAHEVLAGGHRTRRSIMHIFPRRAGAVTGRSSSWSRTGSQPSPSSRTRKVFMVALRRRDQEAAVCTDCHGPTRSFRQ